MTQKKANSIGSNSFELIERGLDELLRTLTIVDPGHVYSRGNMEVCERFESVLTRVEPWRSHVGTLDILEVVGHFVAKAIPDAKQGQGGRLVDMVTAGSMISLREQVRSFFRTIPRAYELWCELPAMQRWGTGQCMLARDIALIETAEAEDKPDDLGVLGAAFSGPAARPKPGSVYLRVVCHGLWTPDADSSTAMTDALSKLKQFFQAAMHLRVFRAMNAIGTLSNPGSAFIVDVQDPELTTAARTSEVLTRFLARVALVAQTKLMVRERGLINSALRAGARPAVTRLEKTQALSGLLAPVAKLLDCPPGQADAARIKTALEWAFDSTRSENQTLALLQACIGLESLLGEDDQDEPLMARLADRCAYLLGKGSQQRTEIRNEFKEVYKVRSKLIHGRNARVSLHELKILESAQNLLSRVIQSETQNFLQRQQDG